MAVTTGHGGQADIVTDGVNGFIRDSDAQALSDALTEALENPADRWTDDVPMVVPEINADHIAIIDTQRKRLGTKRGFVAVKSNCSLQSYVVEDRLIAYACAPFVHFVIHVFHIDEGKVQVAEDLLENLG